MEPWQSWAIVIFCAGTAYYYYNGGKVKLPVKAPAIVEPAAEKSTRRRDGKKTKKATDTSDRSGGELLSAVTEASSDGLSANEPSKKRKSTQRAAAPRSTVQPQSTQSAAGTEGADDDGQDKEWAQQLADLKKGTTLAPPTRTDSRQRTVKQRAANGKNELSAASSTTGADADDDMSPALSPNLGASKGGPSGADVSDMLEPAAPGPSVLRLTDSQQPARTKPTPRAAPVETQETKKQRQNRRKIEERKAADAEAERQRQLLMEKQRRTAREARGEPAKNGLAPSKAPASSVWTSKPQADASTMESSPAVPLLDTFDQASTASSSNIAASQSSITTAGTNWERELPSEEEQMRMIEENDESSWSTVPKGKKGRKKSTMDENTGIDSGDGAVKQPVPSVPDIQQSSTPTSRLPLDYSTSNPTRAFTANAADSEWSVV